MLAALMASIQKTEPPEDQVLEVLAACCLPQLLGHLQQLNNKIRIKSSQNGTKGGFAYLILGKYHV